MESFILIPVIIGTAWACLSLNQPIESFLFGSDYKTWFATHWGLRYDQRNALVVGFAMGFAIVPIIFSISEEALVQRSTTFDRRVSCAGSHPLADLGQARACLGKSGNLLCFDDRFWPGHWRNHDRPHGHGNTPIMDWSLFNGFRTLSANIAVEIPEAPHGGTLYRILFLAAVLLFVFTFLDQHRGGSHPATTADKVQSVLMRT